MGRAVEKINLTRSEDRVRISDEQTIRARQMKARGKSWAWIANRLGVPELGLIRRLDRVLARKMGMRAPCWMYDKSHPDYEQDQS